LHDLPNQLDESVGKLQPQVILPRNSSADFAAQDLVKWRWLVVRLAEEVDLGFQDFVPPARQKTDSAAEFEESKQFQYSTHVCLLM
jgi:hypothetical protein